MRARVGRPTKGIGHVDAVEGSRDAKRRLKVILQVTSGELGVHAGARRLGISVSRLEQLRAQALEGAVASLEKKAPGRPRKQPEPREEEEVRDLEDALLRQSWELEAARVREEIALLWPHLLVSGGDAPRPGKARASRSSRRKSGARRGTGGRRKG